MDTNRSFRLQSSTLALPLLFLSTLDLQQLQNT